MMRILSVTIALVSLLAVTPAHAESTQAVPSDKMSVDEARSIAAASIDLVDQYYVLEDKAAVISSKMRARLAAGAFDLEDPDAFASHFHEVLAEVSGDLHMSFRRNEELYAALKTGSPESDEPSVEEIAHYLAAARRENFGFSEVKFLPGNIGYINLTGFWGESEEDGSRDKMRAAMALIEGADAIIVDVRYNGGGAEQAVRHLQSWFFDKPTHVLTFRDRSAGTVVESLTMEPEEGFHFGELPLYILTSGRTGSAAEDFSYTMKAHDKAVLVGEKTAGAGHLVDFFPIEHGFILGIAIGEPTSPVTGTGWEGIGVVPHVDVPAASALVQAQIAALAHMKSSTEDKRSIGVYDWAILGLEGEANPPEFTKAELRKMAGSFGPRQIIYRDGALYYTRDGRPEAKLIPLSKTVFQHPNSKGFRVRFIWEGKKVVAIEGMSAGRGGEINPRD
jgi:hypothetical protein